jgi:iron complex outermembrane receptor protein
MAPLLGAALVTAAFVADASAQIFAPDAGAGDTAPVPGAADAAVPPTTAPPGDTDPAIAAPAGAETAPPLDGAVTSDDPVGEPAPAITVDGAEEPQAIEELDIEALLKAPVVTASGGRQESRASASANVVSVTRSEIQRRGWTSLAEVLSNVLGFYVVDDYVVPSVTVRGVTAGPRGGSRLIRVMINGVPVNFRPELSAFLGDEYIPFDAVERIEIVKGPLSALYGANSFIAVVNVITRQPAPRAEAAVRVRAGSNYSGGGGSALFSYQDDVFGMLAAFGFERIDRSGLAIERTFAGQDPRIPRYEAAFGDVSEDDVARPVSFYGQGTATKNWLGRVTVQGGVQRSDSMGEFQLNSLLTHESRYALRNDWVSLHHDRDWTDDLASAAWVGYSQGSPDQASERLFLNGNDRQYFQRNFSYRAVDGAIQLRYQPIEALSLTVGGDFSFDWQDVLYYTQIQAQAEGGRLVGDRQDVSVGPTTVREVALSNQAGYLQTTFDTPIEGLRLTGNVRIDRPGDVDSPGQPSESLFPIQYSWRGAAVYELGKDLTVKLVGGQAFQSPSAVLLFARPGFGVTQVVIGCRAVIGGQDCEPQQILSGELGVAALLFSRLSLEWSGYVQAIDNRLTFVRQGSNLVAVNLQNQQVSAGAELSVQAALGSFRPYLRLGLHRNFEVNDVEESIPYPEAIAWVGTTFRPDDLPASFHAELNYVSRRDATQQNIFLNNDDPYGLEQFADVNFGVASEGLRVVAESETKFVLSVRNLLDERHSEPGFGGVDIPNLGRTVLIEVRQVF